MRCVLFLIILGAAYVFYSADGMSGWSQASKLAAYDAAAYDRFGGAVAVSDNVVFVGAVTSGRTSGK